MKKILFTIGILSFFSPLSIVSAAECQENDQICQCSQAWSRGFDAIHEYNVQTVVATFFSQNDIAPADMFSGMRAVKMSYSCGMQSICTMVKGEGKKDVMEKTKLSLSNISGGALPSDFSMCRLDTSLAEDLGRQGDYEDIRADIEKNCSFDSPEQKDQLIQMYTICSKHADISTHIFAYTLQNMLWRDVSRKINGYFHKKVYEFVGKLNELQETVHSFVSNTNAAYGQLCTF